MKEKCAAKQTGPGVKILSSSGNIHKPDSIKVSQVIPSHKRGKV